MVEIKVYNELSPEIMQMHHEESRPFVIKQNLPVQITSKFSLEKIDQLYGDKMVDIIKTLGDDSTIKATISEYLQTFEDELENPYYLHLKLNNDFAEIQESITRTKELDSWFRYLPETIRPTFIWFILGPKKSGSKLHIDLMNTSAWNLLISGKKQWCFENEKGSVEYIQNPEELIIIPPKCAHSVVNLENSLALTENFLNQYNYKDVREYFVVEKMEDWVGVVDKLIDKLC